jgi:hypothetical protein
MRPARNNPLAFRLILLAALALPSGHSSAQAPDLPLHAPVPETRTAPPEDKPPAAPAVPEPRPAAPEPSSEPDNKTPPAVAPPPPGQAPIPERRPDEPAAAPEPIPEPADPRSAEHPADTLPPEEQACRHRLSELGVDFENLPARLDPAGCSIPYPVVVKSLGRTIALQPEAEMNCAMAEAAARFSSDVAAPTARTVFAQELTAIGHASAYVCRPRNGARKLSEHAFGNALDIAAFILADGSRVEVVERPEEKEARFLGALRKAACGPFTTVLGPGSDADHALHFHFDLAPRKNGGTFCQ